jgi:integrase/recombinase XerC
MIELTDFDLSLFEDGRSKKTIEAYVSDLQQFSNWFLQTNGDDLSPQRLTATDLREYKQYLALHKFAPSTVNRRLAAIRAYAAWAGVSQAIAKIKGVKEQDAAPKWLDKRQVSALLREAERRANSNRFSHIRNLVILTVLLNTGLRVSELVALETGDIEISERKGSLKVRGGKGDKTRTIPLNKTARQILDSWIKDNCVGGWARDDHKIFMGITQRTVQNIIHELGRLAKVELTPHSLRHTFAKSLIDAGTPITVVADLLGHEDLETTRIYTTPGQADLERAVESLD